MDVIGQARPVASGERATFWSSVSPTSWTCSTDAAQMIGEERIERVGVQFFARAMLPELMKRPAGIDAEKSEG